MPHKFAIVIPDGAADEPLELFGGKTPLQAAHTPEMDAIARGGVLGRSRNVPDRFLPGSDVATLSLFGYDPEMVFTGRAPLEAASSGVELGPEDWAIRCNLMNSRDDRLTDFTAEHLSSDEARVLIDVLQDALGRAEIEFHPGVSYRNLMVYRGGRGVPAPFDSSTTTVPPHDHADEPVELYLPQGAGADLLRGLISEGSSLVGDHPINQARSARGVRPANLVWLWGQGKAPRLPKFQVVHGLKGAIVSAVDLVRGVAVLAGWDRVDVEGATGYLDTDYAAKGRAGVEALKTHDIVCVHVEAPDEASHEGRADAKVQALEAIDREIIGPLRRAIAEHGGRILVSPDHATLIRTRAHDRGWVPWAMGGVGLAGSGFPYDEASALLAGGPSFPRGHELMDTFLDVRSEFGG